MTYAKDLKPGDKIFDSGTNKWLTVKSNAKIGESSKYLLIFEGISPNEIDVKEYQEIDKVDKINKTEKINK